MSQPESLPPWVPKYLLQAPASARYVGDAYRTCDNCRYLITGERFYEDGVGVCDKEDDLKRNLTHFEFTCSRFAYDPELEASVKVQSFD